LWWIYPLLAVFINTAGICIAWGYLFIDRKIKYRGDFTALVAFQNGTFLPLAFASVLFGPDKLPQFLNLFFLYCLLQVPTFFTLAVWLVNSESTPGKRLKSLLNPPNAATILGLLIVLTGLSSHVPDWIVRPLSTVGSMTPILAAFFIGGIIVTNLFQAKPESWSEPVKAMLLKCMVIPALAAIFVYLFHPPEYIALFIIMQSAMPSALLIALVLPPDEKRHATVAACILLTSLICIVTLPFFMGLFGALYW
ncbi:AEC family transporter, partial [Candidatus Latescibacterota bacterium]